MEHDLLPCRDIQSLGGSVLHGHPLRRPSPLNMGRSLPRSPAPRAAPVFWGLWAKPAQSSATRDEEDWAGPQWYMVDSPGALYSGNTLVHKGHRAVGLGACPCTRWHDVLYGLKNSITNGEGVGGRRKQEGWTNCTVFRETKLTMTAFVELSKPCTLRDVTWVCFLHSWFVCGVIGIVFNHSMNIQ